MHRTRGRGHARLDINRGRAMRLEAGVGAGAGAEAGARAAARALARQRSITLFRNSPCRAVAVGGPLVAVRREEAASARERFGRGPPPPEVFRSKDESYVTIIE